MVFYADFVYLARTLGNCKTTVVVIFLDVKGEVRDNIKLLLQEVF